MAYRNDQDTRPPRDDRWSREAFSMRTMHRWQIWALSAAAIVLLVMFLVVGT